MKIETQVLAAIITGSITIFGGFLINFYLKKKENNTKRLQIKMEYVNKQIEELYGPLYSYIQQIFNYWDVRQRLLSPEGLNHQDRDRIKIFFRERYFSSLHIQIRELIKNKYNLVEGIVLPDSFLIYLQHSTLETTQITIWNELNIDTQHTNGIPWPDDFDKDVKQSLDYLMKKYEQLLKEI